MSELRKLLSTPLPSLKKQARLPFRPSVEEVEYIYDVINLELFDNAMIRPTIHVGPYCYGFWGMCYGEDEIFDTGSYCEIKVPDRWYCIQWMILVLSHEMCHAYQWDVEGSIRVVAGYPRLMSHGTTFIQHRARFKEYGIPLKEIYHHSKWFEFQDLMMV